MQDVSPESPEARAQREQRAGKSKEHQAYALRIVKRVLVGVYSDGFIHAGNLAYLALLTLFPFFIVTAALAHLFGRSQDSARTVASFLHMLPASVRDLLAKPIADVLMARTGSLLWLGALVGLWTVGSFVETIRDILRRAYGTPFSKPFWHYRLSSVGIIIGSVVLVMLAFSAQVALTAAEQFIYRMLPFASDLGAWLKLSKLLPAVVLFGALYGLFFTLTPSKYRYGNCRKWPGALFVALWWVIITAALPLVLAQLGGYDLTYGGLAGTIIALFFFWLVGFGLVIGAHLNAALAETDRPSVKGTPAEA